MAAPKSAPAGSRASTYYSSPDVVPDGWSPDGPGLVEGLQPAGPRLGAQGPDQGFALTIAKSARAASCTLKDGEREDDAIRGCLGIALRRASIFSRAPVVHDLRLAFTIWGYMDESPPTELIVLLRRKLFEGVGQVNHHYARGSQ